MKLEEIQEILAEHENRISFIENSLPCHVHEEPVTQTIEYIHRTSDMSKKEFDELMRIKNKVDYLLKKQTEKRKEESLEPY